jgi:GNAT superfamily N-acetyltransferase
MTRTPDTARPGVTRASFARVDRVETTQARRVAVARAQGVLAAQGLARVAAETPEDTAYFLAAEVAAVLEHRRGGVVDPATLSLDDVAALRDSERAMLTDLELVPRPGALVLLEGDERIGTVCFDDFEGMSPYAQVSSLYVAPAWRGRGVASELLDGLALLLAPAYVGLSLTTYWSWQPAVRFYLRHGCVVRQWKHGLVFLWRTPALRWQVDFAGDVATFTWTQTNRPPRTWTARRRGDWLDWMEPTPFDSDWSDGTMTFALLLALRGWPIARSPEALDEGWRWMDCGYPEGLATRIERWEAWDRHHGYRVETPRLPALPYRDWETLEKG